MGLAKAIEELTVLCRQHVRKCMIVKQEGYPDRLMHMSRIGTPTEFCNAQRFIVRREYEADRKAVFTELVKEPVE